MTRRGPGRGRFGDKRWSSARAAAAFRSWSARRRPGGGAPRPAGTAVVVRDVDDTEVIELALIENLQRKDLTPFEEAEALHGLADRCGSTHEDLAKRLGKSRTAITESLDADGHARGGPPPLSAGRHCC